MSCKEAMGAVAEAIARGGEIPAEQREHLRSCERCRELLDSATQFDSALDEDVAAPRVDDTRITREVRALRLREVMRRTGIAAVLAIVITGAFAMAVRGPEDLAVSEIIGIVAFVTLIAVIPLLLFYALLAALRDRHGNRICKRLGPGRQISGVCLGLSEATGVSPALLRLAFIALAFVNGIGIWLYILLDLAMPVHPDDRQHLLRFKLRRAWQRRFAHAEDDAG